MNLKGAKKEQKKLTEKLSQTSGEVDAFLRTFPELPKFVQNINDSFVTNFFCTIPTVFIVL